MKEKGLFNTAKKFWRTRKQYPNYPFVKERRLEEINYLVPKIKDKESVIDIGCAEGELLHCLMHLTNIKKFYGYDIASHLLKKVHPSVATKVYDCDKPTKLPKTDVAILGAVLPYLFDDEAVLRMLSVINSDLVFIRMMCTLEDQDQIFNAYSPNLKGDYAVRYMTLGHTLELIKKFFIVEDVRRIYPDKIESRYGTKQFYFQCKRK